MKMTGWPGDLSIDATRHEYASSIVRFARGARRCTGKGSTSSWARVASWTRVHEIDDHRTAERDVAMLARVRRHHQAGLVHRRITGVSAPRVAKNP